jgi:hypothetical protein
MALLNMFKQIRGWFVGEGAQPAAQALGLNPNDQETDAHQLPEAIALSLETSIKELPSPTAHSNAVASVLTEVLERWHENTDAPNCLVVLGNPTDHVHRLLHHVIKTWHHPIYSPILLQQQWSERPNNYLTIQSQLIDELEQTAKSQHLSLQFEGSAKGDRASSPQSLIVLPSLDWCFLRCVDGLSGIEYLQQLVLNSRRQFWLVGCNRWAWTFLNHVYQINAYFEQTLSLPRLDGLDLKEWMTPVTNQIEYAFKPGLSNSFVSSEDNDADDELIDWDSKAERKYFESLANQSSGLGVIAAYLWLRSLRYEADESSDESAKPNEQPQPNNSKSSARPEYSVRKPSLPTLPSLDADDRYLLFSLLLHGGMSLKHLTASLGDPDGNVRAKVQVLQRSGVIAYHRNILQVTPAYYLSLKADLARNNFLVGDDS